MATYFIPSTSFPGDSIDARAPQGTNVEVADWGVGRLLDPATGLPFGKPVGNLFRLTFKSGVASGHLGRLMTTGTRMPSVEVVGYLDGGGTASLFYRLLLTDVGVEGMTTSAATGGDPTPMETWSFSYRKVKMTYSPQNPDGTLGAPVATEFGLQNF